jgi:hypothetical protein
MIEDWVFRVPHVTTFLSVVIHRGFLVLCSSLDLATLVPACQVEQGREFESFLDVLSVIYLNSQLAREQRHCWRLLFSSQLHGQSFSQLCGRITHQGPCLAILEDHDGHVFGGFASCSWEVKPQFQGKTWIPKPRGVAQLREECWSDAHHGDSTEALKRGHPTLSGSPSPLHSWGMVGW